MNLLYLIYYIGTKPRVAGKVTVKEIINGNYNYSDLYNANDLCATELALNCGTVVYLKKCCSFVCATCPQPADTFYLPLFLGSGLF